MVLFNLLFVTNLDFETEISRNAYGNDEQICKCLQTHIGDAANCKKILYILPASDSIKCSSDSLSPDICILPDFKCIC